MIFFAKVGIFCKSIAAKRKRIGWSVGFNSWTNWTLFGVLPRSLCKISPNDVQLSRTMLMVLHVHFLSQQQYSRVYALFLAFHALVYRWWWQFFSLFAKDNEHTELTMLLFFQNPYTIFATHILQHYHDFQSNVTVFPSVVQAYTQTYSFSERIKLIICQISHEQSVSIHEISNDWK